MTGDRIKGFFLLLCLLCLPLALVPEVSAAYTFSEQELDNLLAPIALYPDPLLAQILPASTYPAELAAAAGWLRGGGDPSLIGEQDWDENVQAVAQYPQILYMLVDDMDWTTSLGEAFLDQPDDVADAVQRLRWQAYNLGNLASNQEQSVIIDGNYIQIDPAQPQYIYVPVYDYSVIYVRRWTPGIAPFVAFGPGLVIGSWLDLDFDWGRHHIFYHGWNRPGWASRSRPYVHINNVYDQRSRPFINQTWRHDPAHGDPGRYWASRPGAAAGGAKYPHQPEAIGRGRISPGPPRAFVPGVNAQQYSNRGKESLRIVNRGPVPQPPAPTVGPRPAPQAPQPAPARPQPAPRVPVHPAPAPRAAPASPQPVAQAPAVFGGYRGAAEARMQSTRGQASLQSPVGRGTPPAPPREGGRGGGPPGGRGGGPPDGRRR